MRRVAIVENSPSLARDFTPFLDREGVHHRTFRVWMGAPFPGREYDAYILTGDFSNITDGLKVYHRRELELLDSVGLGGHRIFASCFAHQLVAQWKGGRVRRRGRRLLGWERVEVSAFHPALEGLTWFDALCMNTDEVDTLPPGALVAGGSENCRYQLLAYGEDVLTCQSHPEHVTTRNRLLTATVARALAGDRAAYRAFARTRRAADDSSSGEFMRRVVRWLLP